MSHTSRRYERLSLLLQDGQIVWGAFLCKTAPWEVDAKAHKFLRDRGLIVRAWHPTPTGVDFAYKGDVVALTGHFRVL